MAFLNIEDTSDRADAVVFNSIYEPSVELLESTKPLEIKGKVSFRNGDFSIIAESIKEAELSKGRDGITIDISRVKDQEELKILKQTITDNPGRSVVTIFYNGKGDGQKKSLQRKVDLKSDVIKVFNGFIVD